MRRMLAAAWLLLVAAAIPASAGQVLDRVHQEQVLRCGAEPRPGVAAAAAAGRIEGLAVDLCRAVAIAVLGPQGRIAFRLYGSRRDFDALREGQDELAFLSGTAIAAEGSAPQIVAGPTVFIDELALLVPQNSPVRRLQDLAGNTICLMIGSAAQRALEAAISRLRLSVARLAFEEDVEMLDAYNVQRCQAMAGEATRLAAMRLSSGINHLTSRILSPPLALSPVVAATGTADGEWSRLVRWLIQALILGDAPPSARRAGSDSVNLPAAALGLRPLWRQEVKDATGFYADMLRRRLGDGSPLRLARGPNAVWPDGLLLPPASP